MTQRCILLGLTAAMMVSGCSKPSGNRKQEADKDRTETSASASGLPEAPAVDGNHPAATATSQLAPGMWETTLTISSAKAIDVGAPSDPDTLDEFGDIKLAPSSTRKVKVCLSGDEVAKGAPAMMSGTGLPSCKWEKLNTPPGAVSGSLICGEPQSRDVVHAEITGAMLPNLFGTQLHLTIGDPASHHIVSEATMQGERVGECEAGPTK